MNVSEKPRVLKRTLNISDNQNHNSSRNDVQMVHKSVEKYQFPCKLLHGRKNLTSRRTVKGARFAGIWPICTGLTERIPIFSGP